MIWGSPRLSAIGIVIQLCSFIFRVPISGLKPERLAVDDSLGRGPGRQSGWP
jgi:hypothetical protein